MVGFEYCRSSFIVVHKEHIQPSAIDTCKFGRVSLAKKNTYRKILCITLKVWACFMLVNKEHIQAITICIVHLKTVSGVRLGVFYFDQ